MTRPFPLASLLAHRCSSATTCRSSGEVKLARRHTRFISRDMPLLVERAIGRLLGTWHDQGVRFEAYKDREIEDRAAHDLIDRAVDVGICSNRMIPDVLSAWREPSHGEFEVLGDLEPLQLVH